MRFYFFLKTQFLLLLALLFALSTNTILFASEDGGKNQPSPDIPFNISIVTSGPYRAPAQIEIVASCTYPKNKTIERLEFYNGTTIIGTAEKEPYEISWSDVPVGNYSIQAKAYDSENKIVATGTTKVEVVPSNRYDRGWGNNQNYRSSIIALDNEKGLCLDGISDFSTLYGSDVKNYPWFLRAASVLKTPCHHIKCDENVISYALVNTLPKINSTAIGDQPPFVAFGSSSGGTPLYPKQSYSFAIASGGEDFTKIGNIDMQIEVYDKESFVNGNTNVKSVFVVPYSLPKVNEWENLMKHATSKTFTIAETINGKPLHFEMQLQYVAAALSSDIWGQETLYPLLITCKADNANFFYKVSMKGIVLLNGQIVDMAQEEDKSGSACNLSYTLDFDDLAPWSTTLLTLPHFQGKALPSEFEGKSVDELIHHSKPVQDNLISLKPDQYTKVDTSPEVKTHPELDKLIEEKGKDPLALANYVQNEIELTDAVGFNTTENSSPFSINSQGIMRDALATYMEGQGSPIEQCGLLIYLLRKAGVPAAYVFPEHDKTLMFDEQLSKMLHTQLRGTMTFLGPVPVPELIPVNYPWVTAYIDGKWIHLFPWIKDTKVIEGRDLWNYFPNDYNTATKWILKYLYNDPVIRNPWNTNDPDILSEDNPGTLFPLYAEEQLKKNNLNLDDVGIKFANQFHDYASWNDFPRPWQTPLITSSNVVSTLDEKMFDTIEIKVFSNRNGKGASDTTNPLLLQTGTMHFADLHDRRLLLSHQIIPGTANYTITLSLEAYDSGSGNKESTSHTFNQGTNPDTGSLLTPQKISATLTPSDNYLSYQIITKHHQQVDLTKMTYFNQFPGVNESIAITQERPLQKGDMAALALNYGRVSEKMKDFEWQKYVYYENQRKADPQFPIDPEIATGQILQLMGKYYYGYCSQFQQELENLTKNHIVTTRSEGLAKLSPERNANGSPVTTMNKGKLDFNLVYPRVDMFFHKDVSIGNNSFHSESGASPAVMLDCQKLLLLEASSQEHRIINEFFNQKSAISTVRLLDIAQGWTPEKAIATTPGKNISFLMLYNCNDEINKNYQISSNLNTITASLAAWAIRYGLFQAILDLFVRPGTQEADAGKKTNIAIINQTPVTAPGQQGKPYTGMGAFTISQDSIGALISDSHSIDNGGYGGSTTPISSFNPDENNDFNKQLNDLNKQLNDWIYKVQMDQALKQIQNQYKGGDPTSNTNSPATPPSSTTPPTQPGSGTNIPNQQPFTPLPPPSNTTPPTQPGSGTNIPNQQPSTPLPPAQIAILKKEVANIGFIGTPSYYGKLLSYVMDPVSVVNGEFYVNALDLQLNGPMPLELRRTYGSQNLSDNNLGGGWKLGTFPYLMLSADGNETTPASMIYAAEMDGSVIAYHYNADQKNWKPLASDNPDLINANDGTPGPSQNLFNNVISKTADGSYILKGSNGNIRTFATKSFPVLGSPEITRTRPYLDSWRDNQGNSYTFTYGTNNKANDYGQLSAVTSNNGNNIHFHYDVYAHIIEAFSNDGRRLLYSYDKEGNLVKVTLPDNSVITYRYQKGTHLLTQETNPNGRILQNSYDAERRVVTQASTVGVSPTPTTSATFTYNVTYTNSDNTINGTTSVKDASGNITTYTIAGSQISKITYPATGSGINPTTTQEWITQTWSKDVIVRVLNSSTNKRGLVTNFTYDNQGNLTSRALSGKITGSGSNEIAKTTLTYNGNNIVTSITDPVGNSTSYSYSDSSHPFNPTSIVKTSDGKTVSSTILNYGNFGLPTLVSIDGSSTSTSYDTHGFLTSITKSTGSKDPEVKTTITTNRRGEIVSETDSRGILKKYSYDAFGRRTFEETFGTDNKPVDWHGWYYNWNGELEWEQGARFNPVDYTYYDYDRGGHLLHKGTWLSAASTDGKGVTSNGIAATEYGYDLLGNCTSITDPNGHKTTMTYDTLSNMLSRSLGDGAASESFTYEPGGNVATHTTILGGSENYNYNALGQILSASHADGTTSSYRYDLAGRLVQETLPNGTICKTTYQGNSITRTFTDTSGKNLGSTSESHDGRGNLTSKTDLAGSTWNYSYDGLSRVKSEAGPLSEKSYLYKPGCISWVNGKGEWQNTFLDGIGRVVLTTLFNADGSVAYNESNQYSGDHQSVTTTLGTGSNAITTTTYTNLQGHPLLITHPNGAFQMNAYDPNGNLYWSRDESGLQRHWIYNALNQIETEVLPYGDSGSNSSVTYERNPAGEILKRTMPEGLIETHSYDKAGQKVSDALVGSTGSNPSTTRNHTYAYAHGLLSSITDPRGFTTSLSYDGWGHPTSINSSGSKIPEQNQNTTYTYDPRGLLTSVAQGYTTTSTGPSTLVSREYDPEGHLTSESTSLNGEVISSWSQTWDTSGNRTELKWNHDTKGPDYHFSYNALGLLTGSESLLGTCSYAYGDHGLLLTKQTPSGSTELTRDGFGNITRTKLPDASTENLSWRSDHKLTSYSIVGTQNETRNYEYDDHGRLIQEPFTLMESANPSVFPIGTHTAHYAFDDLGVRVSSSVSPTGLNLEGSTGDVIQAKNSFDQPTRDTDYSSGWYYYPWNIGYDGLGEVTSRSIEKSTTQSLTWDSFGRLVRVEKRNEKNQGYNWTTIYDGFGRRLQTHYSDATGTQESSTPLKLTYYYDPEYEFLELGHDNFGRTWNLFGPDRSGTYGGAQGIGGLEATLLEASGQVHGVVNNFFGDALGITTDVGFSPWGNVLGGYGAMPGSSVNADLVPQWRGRYLDWTGFYSLGARYYEPKSGRFLSPDPLGHDASLSLYDYCNGDPVNGLDSDGRCVEKGRELGLLSDMEYQNATNIVHDMNNPSLSLKNILFTILGMELSYVDGDLNNPDFLKDRNQALQETSNQDRIMSINGIFTKALRAQKNAYSIATSLGLDKHAVLRINNYGSGWKDIPRAFYEQLGFIDLRSLYFADIVNHNNGGKAFAYSNGSVVVNNASPYMTPSAKAHFEYIGLNPQRYMEKDEVGFKSVTNVRNRFDLISILFPSSHFKKWDSTLETDNYFFDVLGNHSFQRNLPFLIQH